jgi:serine/threonine protein kinase
VQEIGRYQVLGEIARGGMGVVYKARDPAAQRVVAIKVMLEGAFSQAAARKRFEREAQALAKVRHPNVVKILDYAATARGEPYMVMEWVEGESLQRRLDLGGQLDPSDAVEIVSLLCQAVDACHEAGVLHRDLKPGNVMVTRDGHYKLADFGLARDVDPSLSRTRLSVSGRFMGSPGYWAPEQAEGRLERIGVPTDVYGLGALLYALLTGSAPCGGTTLVEILAALQEPKPPPSSINAAVPAWLDRVVARALAPDPGARFASAGAFAEALAARDDGRVRVPRSLVVSLAVAIVGLGAALAIALGGEPQPAPHVSPPSPGPSTPLAAVTPEPSRAPPPPEPTESPPSALAAFERAVRQERQGHWRQALSSFGEAAHLDPSFAEAYLNRGALHGKLGDHAAAIADCTEALRLDPGMFQAYVNRGASRLETDDFHGALADFSAAVRLKPGAAGIYRNRAIARGLLGDLQGGIADLERSLELEPDHPVALQKLQTMRELLARQQAGSR